MPLYVGALPTKILSPAMNGGDDNDLTGHPYHLMQGFEGSLARLRFHARALSPIHVRVDCEKGAPRTPIVPDDECFRLLMLLLFAVRSEIPRSLLCEKRWLILLFRIAKFGTNRTRQAALRVIRNIITNTAAAEPKRLQCDYNIMNATLLTKLLSLEKILIFKNEFNV